MALCGEWVSGVGKGGDESAWGDRGGEKLQEGVKCQLKELAHKSFF